VNEREEGERKGSEGEFEDVIPHIGSLTTIRSRSGWGSGKGRVEIKRRQKERGKNGKRNPVVR